jgi:hypothetical protein
MPIIGVGEEGDRATRGLPTRRGVPTVAHLALDAAGAVPTGRASRGQRHRSARARVLPDRAPITTFRMWRWWSGWSGTRSFSARACKCYGEALVFVYACRRRVPWMWREGSVSSDDHQDSESNALVPRPGTGLAETGRRTHPVISRMSRDVLARAKAQQGLSKARFRLGKYAFREPDYGPGRSHQALLIFEDLHVDDFR